MKFPINKVLIIFSLNANITPPIGGFEILNQNFIILRKLSSYKIFRNSIPIQIPIFVVYFWSLRSVSWQVNVTCENIKEWPKIWNLEIVD